MLVAKINLVGGGLALTSMLGVFLRHHGLDKVQQSSSVWWVFGIGVVFVLAFAVLLYDFLRQAQRSKRRQVYSLKIVNEGNERDGYELQVEDPSSALEFTLVLNGAKLPQKNVPIAPASVPVEPSIGAEPPPPSPTTTREDKSPARATRGKGGMMGVANAIAGLLTGVGSLLPPSLRSPVVQVATKIRKGQSSVRRVQQMPKRIARATRVSKPASPSSAPRQPTSDAVVQDAHYAETEAFGALAGTQTWARTPFLEPGSTLTVDLLIDPVDPYRPGISFYPFVVKSRSIQQSEGTLVVEEEEAQVTGMTRFQRYGPMLVAFTLACTAISIMAILVF
jgi:hypothetical protein